VKPNNLILLSYLSDLSYLTSKIRQILPLIFI
jgi:hypothetical protein